MDFESEFRTPMVVSTTAVSTSSSAAVQAHPAGAKGRQNAWFVCDQDCYLRFGDASVAAATDSDEFVEADTYFPVTLTNSSTHFTVIAAGAGTLWRFIEGYAG